MFSAYRPSLGSALTVSESLRTCAEFVAHGCDELGLDLAGLKQRDVGLGEIVEFGVACFGGGSQVGLDFRERVEHVVEGVAEDFEFVAGVDLASHLQVAFADAVGHVSQVPDRPDHHVAEQGTEDNHRHDDDHEGCRQQGQPVREDRLVALGDVELHADGAHEFVFLVGLLVAVQALALSAAEGLGPQERSADGPTETHLLGMVQEDVDGVGLEPGQRGGRLLGLVRLGRRHADQPRLLLARVLAEMFEDLAAFGGTLPRLVRRFRAGRLAGGRRGCRKGDRVDVLQVPPGHRTGAVGVGGARGVSHLPPRPRQAGRDGQEDQQAEDEAAAAFERGS
jgi:hypothetical protein